jgi:precorrin-6Y C5,15-methyltransferase (decarboxylating)
MITVIGVDGSPLTARAGQAIADATLVVGAPRHLAAVARDRSADGADGGPVGTISLGRLAPALDALAAHEGDAVVLASGDPGFFGIVRALRDRGLACTVLPAASCVSLAFARAGLPWDDALVVSAHGRDLRRAVNVCRAYPKVAVLTGPGAGPAEIGAALTGWPRRMLVAERLGDDAERLAECTPAAAARRKWDDLNVVLVLADRATAAHGGTHQDSHEVSDEPRQGRLPDGPAPPGPGWLWPSGRRPDGWALPDDAFDHRDSMVTKAEVRALALARLGPGPGALIWDVGAGSGSVAVECARLGAAVIAVERDPEQCARVAVNARRHGVDVRVVGGEAPAALDGLPEPDAVFVGGGGAEVVEAAAGLRPARIVVTLAAVERAGPACAALAAAGYVVDGSLVQAARLTPLPGDVHRLHAANPVFLLSAVLAPHLARPPGAPGQAGVLAARR